MTKLLKTWAKGLLYRPRGVAMGPGALVRRPWTISHPAHVTIGCRSTVGKRVVLNPIRAYGSQHLEGQITIGDDVYIGHDCQLHAMGAMRIGHGCVLSDRVYLNDASHGMDPRAGLIMRQAIHTKGAIRLHDHVFIGVGAVVMPGVEIGHHSVVAAQSVVTRSVPPGSMVAGNPARMIKSLDFHTGQWLAVPQPTAPKLEGPA
jgi:acetyltransferase-like isoleucine patch superfamily enzyme